MSTPLKLPYFEGFANAADVFEQFGIGQVSQEGDDEAERATLTDGVDIRIALYECGSYDGSAIIIFRSTGGKLFEVNDAHCSCNGLENWEPEETTYAALRARGLLAHPTMQVLLDLLEEEEKSS